MSASKLYAYDIETATIGKRANGYTDTKPYKLGNVKDAVKIEAKLKEKRADARDKHALSWFTGRIISVSFVDVFGNEEDEVFASHDETEILAKIQDKVAKDCKLIGKTSDLFDNGFVIGRFMANAMNVPSVFKQSSRLLDVDKFFAFSSQSSQRGRLDDYAFGIDYKAKPMTGAGVAVLWNEICMAAVNSDTKKEAAAWDKLKDYNLHDSKVVAMLAKLYYGDSFQ